MDQVCPKCAQCCGDPTVLHGVVPHCNPTGQSGQLHACQSGLLHITIVSGAVAVGGVGQVCAAPGYGGTEMGWNYSIVF